MFELGPDRLSSLFCVTSLACAACGGSEAPGGEAGPGTSTGDISTTLEEVPSTGATADEPTPTTTSAGSSGAEPGASTSGADSTGVLSGCGDGIVDADEECDDGLGANDDTRFCKANCTLNVCGDGELFVGWELCDLGPGNSDEYGSLCGSQCTPGARCGDHEVQTEFETCDLGLDNGGVKGDEQGILCDTSCRAQQLRGFVTANAFTGDLGGLFGADLKCRDAAAAAGLAEPERFHALLSTGGVDAKQRFQKVTATLPYVLVTGKKFADDFTALIEGGPLGEGIAVSEIGAALYNVPVMTNTAPGGTSFSPDQHCQDWTSADAAHQARVGFNAMPADAPEWSAWKDSQSWIGALSTGCDKEWFHLYCLEI